MPVFLDALRRLEAERTEAREAVGRAIEDAVDVNISSGRSATNRSLAGVLLAITVLSLMAAWLRLRVVAPIVAVASRLRDLRVEDPVDTDVPGLTRADELGDLARGVFEYHQAMEERRVAQRRVSFLAHHDALTGLPNRLLFENRLAHELARSRRTGNEVAVLAIDLDGFQGINDRLGHAAGDRALRRAGELLSDAIRAEDTVARIGGDEFAIIQVADAQPAAAEALLTRLARASAESEREEVAIRMSIGVAVSASDQDGDELYNSADMALYRAKSDGRNTARFFDAALQDEVRLRRRLARDLERAIDGGQLRLAFQPIATASGAVTGFEALLRWRHPELGDIKPDYFIPVAEGTGLIGRIGLWVAERAFSAAIGWPPDLVLSLNLSPIQFRDPDLGRVLLELAERCGIAPSRLEFEVTESATLLGHQREAVLKTLRMLQGAGAAIAMDDFGTGHSSLSNLKDFKFDKLKIDRSFVAGMLEHAPSASIVRATIGLGRSLGMTIVAEGVETDAQLSQLRAWGCDQVQGFLIGRPLDEPLDEAARPSATAVRQVAA
jgi:diguanylate cyclase (GGDEF)-like protein